MTRMHVVALTVALALAGCGGGGDAPSKPPDDRGRVPVEADEPEAKPDPKAATDRLERELAKLVTAAEAELAAARTDAERVAARARLEVLRDKQRGLEAIATPRATTDRRDGGDTANVVPKLEGFANDMCQCSDRACVDRVNEAMTKWGTELARSAPQTYAKVDPDLANKLTDIMTRYTECMTKVMLAGAGGPPP